MNGRIGSGKTTRAKQIAIEKNAALFSIDHHVQPLGQPITNAQEYEKYYFGVRDIIAELALQNLKIGTSVVFDFGGSVGHRDWLRSLAQSAKAGQETELGAGYGLRILRCGIRFNA